MYKSEKKEGKVSLEIVIDKPNFKSYTFEEVKETSVFSNKETADHYDMSSKNSVAKHYLEEILRACDKFYTENPKASTTDKLKTLERLFKGLEHVNTITNDITESSHKEALTIIIKMQPLIVSILPPSDLYINEFCVKVLGMLIEFCNKELR